MKGLEARPIWLIQIAVIIVALSPLFFGAATATFTNDISITHRFMLVFSIPVVLVELFVIAFAYGARLSLIEPMGDWPSWARVALLILVAIAMSTAAIATADPISAFLRTAIWFVHLAFGLAMFALAKHGMPTAATWRHLLAGILAFALGLAIFVMTIPDTTAFEWLDFNFAVTNVRQLGFYATVGCGLAYGLFLSSTDMRWKYAAIVAGSLSMTIIAWSGTRSAIIALLFGLVVAFCSLRLSRSILSLIFLPITFALAVPLSLVHPAPDPALGVERMWSDSAREGMDAKTSGRIELWTGALERVPQQLLFGHGESQFRLMVPANQGKYNHPHNSIIQMLFQWGLVGATCFFALFGWAWFRLWQIAKQQPEIGLPAFMVVSSLFGFSLVEGSLYHTWPVMIMAAVTALAMGMAASDPKPTAQPGLTRANAKSRDHPK